MAIGTAIQNGGFVRVYDEKGRPIYSKPGELYGFTSTTVSIKVGSFIHIYDAKDTQSQVNLYSFLFKSERSRYHITT